MHPLRASPAFGFAVLVTLGFVGFSGLMIVLMQLQPGFLGMAHFTEVQHRTHDLTFGFLFLPAVVGMLSQLRAPSRNVAGQLMALVPWAGLVLTLLVTMLATGNRAVLNLAWLAPAALTLLSAVLHPAGRELYRSFSVSRVNWVMLALVAVAAVPLLRFAAANIELQGTVADDHARLGHYGFMAAFGLTVVGVGLLASLRPDGWRPTAWVAGLLPAFFGLASLMFQDVSSSLGPVWALAAIAWGAAFAAAAQLTGGPTVEGALHLGSGDDSGVAPERGSTTGTRGSRDVLAVVAILVVLLLVVMHLAGGGIRVHSPGSRTPPSDTGSWRSPGAATAARVDLATFPDTALSFPE